MTGHPPTVSPHHTASRQAFTLVELAIVLAILGLLIGGLLAGQSMIRASELRNVTVAAQTYQAAMQSFYDKYSFLPGDMPTAQNVWGVQHADPATCKATASTSTLTCNGDGNGQMSGGAAGSYENFRAWQHMANAGMIEGTYTGVGGSGGWEHADPGKNIPAGKIANSGYSLEFAGIRTGDADRFDGNYKHVFRYGEKTANAWTNNAVMTAAEMWNLDVKADDGKPAYGTIMAFKSSAPNCATTTVSTTAEYAVTRSTKDCLMIYKTGL